MGCAGSSQGSHGDGAGGETKGVIIQDLDRQELDADVKRSMTHDATYLISTVTLNSNHNLSTCMPSTAEDFVRILMGGEQPCFTGANETGLTCTEAQVALLPPLIAAFNSSNSAHQRFELLNTFMTTAAAAEKAAGPQVVDGVKHDVKRYEVVPSKTAETVYYVEDFPSGTYAHGKTLATGVWRWARFVALLLDSKVESFASAKGRDEVLRMMLNPSLL